MAEDLELSTPTGSKRTGKIAGLSPEQALEILQAAAAKCQQSGISVKAVQLYGTEPPSVAIVLANVEFHDGNLVLAESNKETSS